MSRQPRTTRLQRVMAPLAPQKTMVAVPAPATVPLTPALPQREMWGPFHAAVMLIAVIAVVPSPSAIAWTPCGYGPFEPGYQGGYPNTAAPGPQSGPAPYEPGLPPPAYPVGGYASQWGNPYAAGAPTPPYGDAAAGTLPSSQAYPGYSPWTNPSWGYPGFGTRSFGPPAGFRISRKASEDAYTLTIELEGMTPEEVQVRTQGQWILISRKSSAQQVQQDSFDKGRGYMQSFSYSSGRTSQRLSVPRDGDLSAMSREDGESSIYIRIPRRSG